MMDIQLEVFGNKLLMSNKLVMEGTLEREGIPRGMSQRDAQSIGAKLTNVCEQRGIFVPKTAPHDHFYKVNQYPLLILDELFMVYLKQRKGIL